MKISIIGSGWLAGQLKLYSKYNNQITCLSRTSNKEGHFFAINSDGIQTNFDINDSILFFMIPPNRDYEKYKSLVKIFINYIDGISFERIFFISSISVETKKNDSLKMIEDLFLNKYPNSVILRMGGLYGDQRWPAKFLSGKSIKVGKNEKVQLISGINCSLSIDCLLDNLTKLDSHYCLVEPNELNKADYYSHQCKRLNLTLPKFEFVEIDQLLVDGNKICRDFGFKYKKM